MQSDDDYPKPKISFGTAVTIKEMGYSMDDLRDIEGDLDLKQVKQVRNNLQNGTYRIPMAWISSAIDELDALL